LSNLSNLSGLSLEGTNATGSITLADGRVISYD